MPLMAGASSIAAAYVVPYVQSTMTPADAFSEFNSSIFSLNSLRFMLPSSFPEILIGTKPIISAILTTE